MTHPLAHRLAAGAPDWARRPMLAWDRDELNRRRPFVTASEWRAFSTIELPERADPFGEGFEVQGHGPGIRLEPASPSTEAESGCESFEPSR